MLPHQEVYREGMRRFTAAHRRLEWLAVRVLLYTLSGEEKEIAYHPSGKPYLADDSASLSISHTKGYVGVVGWMVPGGREIAIKTAELMQKYDVVIWAHHGMFCSGEDFDLTFGLLHTVEKSAEILVKILSMTPNKLQTITPDNFRSLARDFKVSLPEEFLYEKQ